MRPALEIGKFLLFSFFLTNFPPVCLSLEVNHAQGIFRWAGFESWLKILSRGVGRRHPTSPPLFSPKAYCWLSPTICFYSSFCYCSTGASSRGWKTQTLCKPSKFREKKEMLSDSKVNSRQSREGNEEDKSFNIKFPCHSRISFYFQIQFGWKTGTLRNLHDKQRTRERKSGERENFLRLLRCRFSAFNFVEGVETFFLLNFLINVSKYLKVFPCDGTVSEAI